MTTTPTCDNIPALRILLVCDGESGSAVPASATCHRLAEALAATGQHPLVLQPWPAATETTETRPSARVQDRPYTVYCSRSVIADIALLALIEQPALAVTLGPHPIALAQPLLDSGVPSLAWLLDAKSLHTIPGPAHLHRLGLAAASNALAAQASTMTGTTVHAMLPPLSYDAPACLGSGSAVLVPSTRHIDGMQRVLEMARARPQWPFVCLCEPDSLHSTRAQLASVSTPNVTVMELHQASGVAARAAVLPALSADLPWDTLAWCMARGLPVLGSTETLLEESLGDAGLVLPARQPLEAWLDGLDQLMLDDVGHAIRAEAATARASGLRLAPPAAARQFLQIALRHLRAGGHRISGPA